MNFIQDLNENITNTPSIDVLREDLERLQWQMHELDERVSLLRGLVHATTTGCILLFVLLVIQALVVSS